MGTAELVAGSSYAIGPIVGGALFEWGGFRLPFLCQGALPFGVMVVLQASLTKLNRSRAQEEGRQQRQEMRSEEGAGKCAVVAAVGGQGSAEDAEGAEEGGGGGGGDERVELLAGGGNGRDGRGEPSLRSMPPPAGSRGRGWRWRRWLADGDVR